MAMDILADANTDAADRGSIDVDAKVRRWLLSRCPAQEFSYVQRSSLRCIDQLSANLTPAFCTSRYGKSQINDSS